MSSLREGEEGGISGVRIERLWVQRSSWVGKQKTIGTMGLM